MFFITTEPSSHVLAITVYLVGTASPGPSNLAIMNTAMSRGRADALALAGGVITGSLVWGLSAAFGFSSLIGASSWPLVAIKVLGGLYLLWLSWKAATAARARSHVQTAASGSGPQRGLAATYRTGVGMHLTNPKAIVVWASVIALALPQGGKEGDALLIVGACALLGAVVFVSYALAFSTQRARKIYRAMHRWCNGTLALVLACAGVRLLLSSTSAF